MTTGKVMVFGTFDIFHEGHKDFLRQAREFGDYLVVVVARDKTVSKVKGREPRNDEERRKRVIEKSGLVDKVILGNLDDKYAVIKQEKPDFICLGYDQEFFIDKLRDKLNEFGFFETQIVRLKSHFPEKYKSSKLDRILR